MGTSRLLDTWFKELPLSGASSLFEMSPSYLFSFFLVSDCERRIAWDFKRSVFSPYLRRFMGRLQSIFDLEIDAQVVQCSSLKGSASKTSRGKDIAEVTVEDLKADFLRNAGEWPGDTVTKDATWLPPLVRLAAFWPSSPLHVLDAEQQPQRAFAVPGWGVVALAGAEGKQSSCAEESCTLPDSSPQELSPCEGVRGPESPMCHAQARAPPQFLSPCEAQRVASAWVSVLRAWLTLHPDAPSPSSPLPHCSGLVLLTAKPQLDGLARWEHLLVAKVVHTLFVRRAAETLHNFIALVDSLPDLEIRAEIGEIVAKAAASAQEAVSQSAMGNLKEALEAARLALRLSLTASHDDTVVAQMYFSWQFKGAVYLPLMMPIVMPTLMALFRDIKRWRKKIPESMGVVAEEVQ